jgi:hypothetical protein
MSPQDKFPKDPEIKVDYDYDVWASCCGTLMIFFKGEEIYKGAAGIRSLGSAHFDEDWNEEVLDEGLTCSLSPKDLPVSVDDAKRIIQQVEFVLKDIPGCCGGCI